MTKDVVAGHRFAMLATTAVCSMPRLVRAVAWGAAIQACERQLQGPGEPPPYLAALLRATPQDVAREWGRGASSAGSAR